MMRAAQLWTISWSIHMLILSRKSGEGIRIGEDVVIHILKSVGGAIKVGIDAPRSVRVVRDELPTHRPHGGQPGREAA